MTRPASELRRAPLALAVLAGAALALGARPAAAQQEVQPRAPALELRPSAQPAELAREPADSLLRRPALEYDPWLGVVRRARPFGTPGPGQEPGVGGLDLLTWIRAERAREGSRLRAAAWARALGHREPGEEDQGLIPELQNPLKIPEPLAKVFGEGSDFDIQGKLHLSAVGSRSKQKPDLRSDLLRRAIGGFDLSLDQILDLKVVGTVGTKLDVAVDFNSSRELDSKQLITASYTGTEDEILKKVEVGDIRLALPPSRFVGTNVGRGTFGAQAIAQLGPVDLRILGSRKEGQSTNRSLSISPGGEGVLQQVTLDIKDTQFQDDRFFLLFHPDSLAGGRLAYPNSGTSLANQGSTPEPGSLNVWLDDGNPTNNRENASKQGIAYVNPTDQAAFPEQAHQGFFDLLVEGQDYVVTDGIVVEMKRQLNDNEVLAVSYTTRDGTQVGSPQAAEQVELKLIKPVNPDTTDFTWDYTLRNVYSLREPDIQLGSLALSVYRGNSDLKQTFETVDGESRKYSEIFGVTDESGRIKVPRLLRDPFGGSDYLVLPDVRPFYQPTTETGQPIQLEVPNRKLYYNNDPRKTALDDQVYFIEASYLSRGGLSGEVELGAANILEGSETITMGGETLVRGTDYQIFYDFGKVVFSDPAALSARHPDASINISFEVAPLFNLAPTSLYGAAGTWNIGENAAINSTFMVQNKRSLANRPILGAEPTRTAVGEVDGTWASETPFLTHWLDALPGLDTEEPSNLSVRAEMAFSQPDPNTSGEVFLNDFENVDVAKRINPYFRAWRLSSIPTGTTFGLLDVADLKWYTFAFRTEQVTPGVVGVDRGTDVFTVRLDPRGETPAEQMDSWRSIHTVLSTTGEDVTRQEFLEFFVKGERGKILVDLGAVDEDQVRLDRNSAPVGVGEFDTEERNPDTRDNNLDVGEDTGIDGVAGADLLNVVGDDGNDDFDQTFQGGFPANPNGTENNTTLDTEDDNLNGILDRQENAIRWEVDLGDSRYEVPGSRTGTGFRKIRLPLTAPDQTLGSPDLRNVRVLRMTFTGVERETEFQIADMEIVGSTFLKRGIVAADGTPIAGVDSDSLVITSVNDLENPGYQSPPGVVAQQDRADQVAGVASVIREQSLELGYEGLPPGARGTIFRPQFDRESYIDYRAMRVWVQGRGESGAAQPDFFVSFGIDTLNVYEYAAPLPDHDWEEHVIDFGKFTELKKALLDSLDAAGADRVGVKVSEDGRYRVRIGNPNAPPPTLTEVGQLTIGVENDTAAPVSGSFWIDEWRLTAPVRDGGTAGYVNAHAKLADFGNVALTWESRGAQFRSLGATRNNFASGTFDASTSFQLEKFLPESWGIALPLTWDHSGDSQAPLYKVGSDIVLDPGAERDAQTRTNSRDVVTLRAFRSRESSNPLIAATLDDLEARITFRGESFGSVDLDTDRSRVNAHIGYRHGFRERGLPLGLRWVGRLPLPEPVRRSDLIQRLAGAKLNLVPANVVLTGETTMEERNVTKKLADQRDFTADSTHTLRGLATVSFQPFRSMRATIGLDNTRDLLFPETVVQRGALGVNALRNRTLDFDWSPPISDWLTPRYSYTSRYTRNHTREASRALDSLDLRDFSITTNRNLTVELALPPLIETFLDTEGRAGTPWYRKVFEPIRFDRTNQKTAAYVQEIDDPGFGFTLGFGDLAGAADGAPQSVSTSRSRGISSGLNLFGGMRVRTSYRETETSRQYFEGTNDGNTRTWPDVEVRWPNLRPPAFLRRTIPNVALSSSYERRTGANRANGHLLDDSDRSVWDPLLAVTFTWGNGMTTDLRAETSSNSTRQVRGGATDSRRKETSTDLTLNVNYTVRPGTTLWIPFPTLWGVKIQKPLRTALTLARRYREDRTALGAAQDAEAALNLDTATTEVRPSLSYEFGRVVSGMAFSYLSRKDRKRDITNTTMSLEAYLDFLF